MNPRYWASAAFLFGTDYLVICGRASTHSMYSAGATLSPIHSSKYIVAQILCPAQRAP
jgi:hypothetical protein